MCPTRLCAREQKQIKVCFSTVETFLHVSNYVSSLLIVVSRSWTNTSRISLRVCFTINIPLLYKRTITSLYQYTSLILWNINVMCGCKLIMLKTLHMLNTFLDVKSSIHSNIMSSRMFVFNDKTTNTSLFIISPTYRPYFVSPTNNSGERYHLVAT